MYREVCCYLSIIFMDRSCEVECYSAVKMETAWLYYFVTLSSQPLLLDYNQYVLIFCFRQYAVNEIRF